MEKTRDDESFQTKIDILRERIRIYYYQELEIIKMIKQQRSEHKRCKLDSQCKDMIEKEIRIASDGLKKISEA